MVDSPTDAAADRPGSFLRSVLQTYSANVLGAVLSLVSVLIIARALGAEGRGNVAFLTALVWFSASLATLGVQEANANLAASDPATRRSLATNSLLLSMASGGCAIAILAGLVSAVPAVGGEVEPLLRWIAIGFMPVLIAQVCLRLLAEADYAFAISNGAYLIGPLVNVTINGLFAALGMLTVQSAVGVWLAGQLLGTALLVWYVARRLAGFGRPDAGLARRALRFGLRAHVGRVMQIGNYRLDQVLLGAIGGPRELGLYSIAVAWAEALWYLPAALSYVQRPYLVRARGRLEAAQRAARTFRATLLVTIAAAAVLALGAPLLCEGLFGAQFAGSVDDLRVLVVGALGIVALKLLGSALVAAGRPGLQSVAIGCGFVATVALDIALIPSLGGLGAALASTIAYSAAGLVVAAIFVRVQGARPADLLPRVRDLVWLRELVRGQVRARASAPLAGPDEPSR